MPPETPRELRHNVGMQADYEELLPPDGARRRLLIAAAALPLTMALPRPASAQVNARAKAATKLAALENEARGRLGVCAVNLAGDQLFAYRETERFPMCSTFKAMLVAAILLRSALDPALMQQKIRYFASDMVPYAPVTEKFIDTGMTVEALCDAAIRYSDNVAGNLLLRLVDGPEGLTQWMRSLGDTDFRLDRWETELNSAIPGDPRDTTTPGAMARSLWQVGLGNVLPPPARERLLDWLKRNTTGDARIRAGMPKGWTVGDKTGSGAYGATNDIALLWPPAGAADPAAISLAVYFAQESKDAVTRSDVIAEATRIVAPVLA